MNEEKNAIVIYSSMYKQFMRLLKKNPEMGAEYIKALLQYGFEGIEPDEDSDVWIFGFEADNIKMFLYSFYYIVIIVGTTLTRGKKGKLKKQERVIL